MPFELNKIVPWGRSFDEYVRMFDLSLEDLDGRILGCGDGPASFNGHMNRFGRKVVSCDPIYEFSVGEIENRIDETFNEVMRQTIQNKRNFVWDLIRSPEELGSVRMASMREFLADYERGREEGRYVSASLPKLPFEDDSFDLALSSHFLFLYSEQLSVQFHVDAILEMCRVAKVSRIFPILNMAAKMSPHVEIVKSELAAMGYQVSIRKVNYEFQRCGNQMMEVRGKNQ
jgi:hypothetical protein